MKCIDCGTGILEFNEPFDNAPHGDSWYECVCGAHLNSAAYDEIARLRSIVEPLEALLAKETDAVIIWRHADCYTVEPDATGGVVNEIDGDTLPAALAASLKSKGETDGL